MKRELIICSIFLKTCLFAGIEKDIVYAMAGDNVLKLDLHKPEGVANPPVIVWVHGGAWRSGSKDNVPVSGLLSRGWAIASVEYRLSPVARFPAQAHDIKAAIRYLRAHSIELGIYVDKLVVAGSSAGGHLAALVGVSNGNAVLEGSSGGHLDQSSDVHAVVSYYGASNLTTILQQSTPEGLNKRVPALELLLGGLPDIEKDLAMLASPVFHVDANDPPILMLHGDQDSQMPINQSHELEGRCDQSGVPAEFIVVHGAGHGGKAFFVEERLDFVDIWLREALDL